MDIVSEINVHNWKSHSPKCAADFDKIIKLVNQPLKNPAPRGKRIIHPTQARYLYFDTSQEESCHDSTISSTSSSQKSKVDISYYATPMKENRRLLGAERKAHMLKMLQERQMKYHEQEMALGGYHDVFNDPFPDFKPQNLTHDESAQTSDDGAHVSMEDGDFTSPNILSDNIISVQSNEAVNSLQGRVGQGCSTPRNAASHTLAPLLNIDVSAVNVQDKSYTTHMNSKKVLHNVSNDFVRTSAKQPITYGVSCEDSTDWAGSNALDDSIENVLSKMRGTPKRVTDIRKSKAFTLLNHEAKESVATTDVSKKPTIDISVKGKNATFIVHTDKKSPALHDSQNEADNGPLTLKLLQNETLINEKEATSDVSKASGIPPVEPILSTPTLSNNNCSSNVVFAVPDVPVKKTRAAKVSVHEREDRVKKNSSILELMNVDVKSPGRTLFSNFPSRKQQKLSITPINATSHNEDTMEISIVMSDISQQPSIEVDDGSILDPVTDPRSSHASTNRSKQPLTASVNETVTAPVTPLRRSNDASRTNYASLNSKERKLIIQRSVERLSQTRAKGSCRRIDQRCRQSSQVSSNSSTLNQVSEIEPVTPFQPTDPSRMFTSRADRSGTVCRFPQSRRQRLASKSPLFSDDQQKMPKGKRTNLFKRMGDYKPKAPNGFASVPSAFEASAEQEPVQDAELLHDGDNTTLGVDSGAIAQMSPECPAQSSHTFRVPAGKNAASVTPSEMEVDSSEDNFLDAARRLSLEDTSPTEVDQSSLNRSRSCEQVSDRKHRGLLMDSVFTTDTYAHSGDNLDFLEDAQYPLEKAVDSNDDSILPFDPNCSDILNCKHDVMVLKPRKVVRPSTPNTPNVRRSMRNRMKPVRQHLGEKAEYTVSPGGSRTLVGVNEVEIREKRWLRVWTANYDLAYEREKQLAECRRHLREERRQQARKRKIDRLNALRARHRRGLDLNVSVDTIVTSSDEEDSA